MFHSVEAAGTACQRVEQFFALRQRWKMFAPRPTRLDGWVSLEAHLADGRTLELVPALRRISDAPPTVNKRPESLANWYPNARWRKYFMCLFWDQRTIFHPRLGVFLAQKWNRQSPEVPVLEIHALVFQRDNALKEPVGSEQRTEFLLYADESSQPSNER